VPEDIKMKIASNEENRFYVKKNPAPGDFDFAMTNYYST